MSLSNIIKKAGWGYLEVTGAVLLTASFSWTSVSVQESSVSSLGLLQVFCRILPLILVALYLVRRGLIHKLSVIPEMVRWPALPFTIYAIVAAVSGIRFGMIPLLACWKSVEVLILTYWACHLGVSIRRYSNGNTVLIRMIKLLTFWMLLTLALALFNPSMGFREQHTIIPWLMGYFPPLNPNTIGVSSAICLFALVGGHLNYSSRRMNRFILIGLFFCIIFAQSRTSIFCLVAVSSLYLVTLFKKPLNQKTVLYIAIICIGIGMALIMQELILTFMMRGQDTEEILGASGRIEYWRIAWESVKENPIWGGGMATGSRFLFIGNEDVWRHNNVNLHNTFMEMLVGGGFLGATLVAAAYISCLLSPIWRVFKYRGYDLTLAAGVGVILTVRMLTSIGPALFSTDMLLVLIVLFQIKAEKRGATPGRVLQGIQASP
jgi:O-antigen ligase